MTSIPPWPPVDGEIENAILAQLRRSTSIYDRSGVILEVERKFEDLTGVKYALLTSSGTAALHSAYYALGIGVGDEVLVPAYTFFATAMPLFQLGALPVLVDIDDSGEMSVLEAAALVSSRTKALVLTHMWGHPSRTSRYRQFCDARGLLLVEDCSHAHGATIENRSVGQLADVSIFSLQAAKLVPAGEGGVLCTNSAEIYHRANLLGHFNKRSQQEMPESHPLYGYAETGLGLKYRIHALGAALASVMIDRLPDYLAAKRANARSMEHIIRASRSLELLFASRPEAVPAYYALPTLLSQRSGLVRDEVMAAAEELGFAGADIPHSSRSLSHFRAFREPLSPVTIYSENCIRRTPVVAEVVSDSIIKFDVPYSDNAASRSYIALFDQLVSMIDRRSSVVSRRLRTNPEVPVMALTEEAAARIEENAAREGVEQIVVGAIIWRKDRGDGADILLLRRIELGFMGGIEELPGGGVEEGEVSIGALLREVLEETALEIVKIDGLLGTFDYENEYGMSARQLNFSVQAKEGQQVRLEPSEHQSFRWIDPASIEQSDCSAEVISVVRSWREKFSEGRFEAVRQ